MSAREGNRLQSKRNAILSSAVKITISHLPGELNYSDYATRPSLNSARPAIDNQLIEANFERPGTFKFEKQFSRWRG